MFNTADRRALRKNKKGYFSEEERAVGDYLNECHAQTKLDQSNTSCPNSQL
jgi:hypothetical protein